MEALRRTQRCAALLVDKAARETKVEFDWARDICLHKPYQRCLKAAIAATNSSVLDGSHVDPLVAAADLLVDQIGSLQSPNEEAMKQMLQYSGESDGQWQLFAPKLWELCRNERLQKEKPTAFSLVGAIGGLSSLSDLITNKGLNGGLEAAGDVSCVREAISEVVAEDPPFGCSRLKVTVDGAGKYRLQTQSPPELEQEARAFLGSAMQKIELLHAARASSDEKRGKISLCGVNPDGSTEVSVQPSMQIGLIGDVANGKSTLIRAITGKRTQAHSSEQQKHGMTIRLGFANASVMRCQADGCGLYCFRQDELATKTLNSSPQCSYCGGSAEMVTRVSFIDCPGHAELMGTMLSGASAFDAVIFAAAANVPCPTPQARQHLEALRTTNCSSIKGRLAVVQTKAELVANQADREAGLSAKEKLALHTENAKEKLADTVAAGAPFFPVCSPMGLGLEPLAEWMANLSDRKLAADARGGDNFKVLRSFDVNYAGTDATKLLGGVLGGSISGDVVFRRGDSLELRPGIVLGAEDGQVGQRFRVQPLRFQVKDIMTDKTTIHEAKAGGLVALQTTLCPSLCADDRLVGSVVGHPDKLPPIFGPTLLLGNLTLITPGSLSESKNSSKKTLKKGSKVRCHSGTAMATGRVVRVSTRRGKIEIELDRPICAFRDSVVALEAKPSEHHTFTLVAHGSIIDGTVCREGKDIVDTDNSHACDGSVDSDGGEALSTKRNSDFHNDAVCEDIIRQRFLDELAEKQDTNNAGGRERISIPTPSVTKDGGAHVLIDNFAAIALALNRDPSHLQAYLTREGGMSCARAGEYGGALRVRYRGRGFAELLRRMIRRYVVVYVTCQQCKSAKTEFLKGDSTNQKTVEVLCRQCCARRYVAV